MFKGSSLQPRARLGVLAVTLVLAASCDRRDPPPPAEDPRNASAAPEPAAPEPVDKLMAADSPITLEDIATYPQPGMAVPGALRFSPDGRYLTWLDSAADSLSRELFALALDEAAEGELRRVVEPPGGGVSEDSLSPEEKLARERMRQRALGITSYAWATYADRMLLPINGEIWIQDGVEAELRLLVAKAEDDPRPALNPTLSPDGSAVAYVKGGELWVVSAEGDGSPRQLTTGVTPGRTRGLAEYIAAEEMGRHRGFWWAPDGASIAFIEVDETHIPIYRIVHQGKDEVGGAAQEDHAYPFAGTDNARVRLGVVTTAASPTTRWLDLKQADWAARAGEWTRDAAEDFYLARVDFKPDGALCVQVQDRRQTELRLLCFEGAAGTAKLLLRERSEVWINLHDMFEPLKLDPDTAAAHPEQLGGFIWASEASGYMHLSLRDKDGNELVQLTSGEWMVEGIASVNEAKQKLIFAATKEDPRERHYYEIGFDGQGLRKLTEARGMHGLVVDREHRYFVDSYSTLDSPPRVELRALDSGELLRTLHPASDADLDPRIEQLQLDPPALVELLAADGETPLFGAIYQPDPQVFAGPYPTIVSVYGGPHAQRVSNSWGMSVDLRAQYLRDHGYLVFKVDNRGSSRRGLAFEGALRHDMGKVEIQDQVAAVDWLIDQGITDRERVAIYGWSYGGYMSAMALARAPETFKVGIAGAPVTHWDGYDTHYTERYMGLPQENEEGYARSSVMAHVEDMRGKLLLVHGLIDENVHFRHSARLINALIAAGKDFDLQLYPDERHMPRKLADRVYMERRIFDYLRANL